MYLNREEGHVLLTCNQYYISLVCHMEFNFAIHKFTNSKHAELFSVMHFKCFDKSYLKECLQQYKTMKTLN